MSVGYDALRSEHPPRRGRRLGTSSKEHILSTFRTLDLTEGPSLRCARAVSRGFDSHALPPKTIPWVHTSAVRCNTDGPSALHEYAPSCTGKGHKTGTFRNLRLNGGSRSQKSPRVRVPSAPPILICPRHEPPRALFPHQELAVVFPRSEPTTTNPSSRPKTRTLSDKDSDNFQNPPARGPPCSRKTRRGERRSARLTRDLVLRLMPGSTRGRAFSLAAVRPLRASAVRPILTADQLTRNHH